MLIFNILLLVVPYLLVGHIHGAEIAELAPELDEGQDSFYFLTFKEGDGVKEMVNNVEFAIFTDEEILSEEHHTVLRLYCREIDGIKSVDVVTNAATGEDKIILDTLFIKACDYEAFLTSIFPHMPSPGQEIYIFVDTDGNCHKRTYKYYLWQFTATVQRSSLESISCPEAVTTILNGNKGTVESWSPDGLALQTFFMDKPVSGRDPEIQTLDFPGASGFSLVCRTDMMKYLDPVYATDESDKVETPPDDQESKPEEEEYTLFTATVNYNGVPLDRVKLKTNTCSVNNITPKTGHKGTHTISFKTSEGVQKREYKLSITKKPTHDEMILVRKSSS